MLEAMLWGACLGMVSYWVCNLLYEVFDLGGERAWQDRWLKEQSEIPDERKPT
jgi:hypothetical protein